MSFIEYLFDRTLMYLALAFWVFGMLHASNFLFPLDFVAFLCYFIIVFCLGVMVLGDYNKWRIHLRDSKEIEERV